MVDTCTGPAGARQHDLAIGRGDADGASQIQTNSGRTCGAAVAGAGEADIAGTGRYDVGEIVLDQYPRGVAGVRCTCQGDAPTGDRGAAGGASTRIELHTHAGCRPGTDIHSSITSIDVGGLPEIQAHTARAAGIHADVAAPAVDAGEVVTRHCRVERDAVARGHRGTCGVAIGIHRTATAKEDVATACGLRGAAVGGVEGQGVLVHGDATGAAAVGVAPEHQRTVIGLKQQVGRPGADAAVGLGLEARALPAGHDVGIESDVAVGLQGQAAGARPVDGIGHGDVAIARTGGARVDGDDGDVGAVVER